MNSTCRFREGDMPRILLLCSENVLCERLRQAFQPHTEFEIVAEIKVDTDTISKATEARPDLVIVEMANDPNDALNTAERLNDGQTWRASVVVHQYRKLFPEDPIVRDALQPSANPAQLQATPARVPPTAPPR